MNTDLKQNEIRLASSPDGSLTRSLIVNQELRNEVPFSVLPTLEGVLDQISPLPKKFLLFGQAEDELPVLLDLSNPDPGPILIAGDAGAGKTHLLRLIARFVASTHRPEEIQYGVITACPDEWKGLIHVPHCIGVFSTEEQRSVDYIQALALWIGKSTMNGQAVLLMIDGLEQFAGQNHEIHEELRTILLQGPARQIWPIVTLSPNRLGEAGAWLKYFHTRVFGWARHVDARDDDRCLKFESLAKGIEFSLKENSRWTKFRVPRV